MSLILNMKTLEINRFYVLLAAILNLSLKMSHMTSQCKTNAKNGFSVSKTLEVEVLHVSVGLKLNLKISFLYLWRPFWIFAVGVFQPLNLSVHLQNFRKMGVL